MAQYEARLSGRSPAVLALGDLHVCPADPNRNSLHEHRAVSEIGLRNIFQLSGVRFLWFYRDRFHHVVSFIKPLGGRFGLSLRLQSRTARIQISFAIP